MKTHTPSRRWLTAALLAFAPIAAAPSVAAELRDPRAVAIADAVEQAIAPPGAWNKIAGLRFTFQVVKDGVEQGSIRHIWNTKTGRYRVEGKGDDGREKVVIFDIATRQGEAWVREMPAPGAAAGAPGGARSGTGWVSESPKEPALEWAYGRFINDTYWLLMPLKMKDPGVNLAYEGDETGDGQTWDVLKLTFAGVGLTPGDTYWVYVNRSTHLVDRWDYILQGREGQKRTTWLWKDWTPIGPLRLSTNKTTPDGKVAIRFPGVEALTTIPASAFDPPR